MPAFPMSSLGGDGLSTAANNNQVIPFYFLSNNQDLLHQSTVMESQAADRLGRVAKIRSFARMYWLWAL
jgi:hypothetical protein